MNLNELLKLYLKESETKNLSSETIKLYRGVITNFFEWLDSFQVYEIGQVNKKHIRDYLVSLSEKGVKPISSNKYKQVLKLFWDWAIEEKIDQLSNNPVHNIKNKKVGDLLPSYVPIKEMEAVFESFETASTFSVTQMVMFECFYATGIRTSELTGLEISDIDFKNEIIHVRHGKGKKERIVPFPKSLTPVLKRYLQIRSNRNFSSEYLFPNAHGNRMDRKNAYKYIKKILETTSSRKKGAHTLRHSYASHLLSRGANIKAIQDLLGHSSIESTMVYLHLDEKSLRRAFEKAHPKA